MTNNEDIYQYQFESMLQKAKDVLGRPALFWPDSEENNEIGAEIKAARCLFDVSGPDFSRFKAFESEYRYWVEVYVIKIIEKLLERSDYPYEERSFGGGKEQYAIYLSLGGKRIAAYFLYELSYQEGDRTDYDQIGIALKNKSGDVDEIRLYLFQSTINEFSLAYLVNESAEMNANGFISVLTLKDFFSELWGEEEYTVFKEYAEDYALKINRVVGYKTVITPTHNTFRVFRTLKAKMLQEMDYRAIAKKGELGQLSMHDFDSINMNYLRNKMYNAMISSNDFADSFLSAEWAYDVYKNAMGELELTGIISGYLKSIEQLLYKIARFHRDQDLKIKTKTKEGFQTYTSTNEEIIDSSLGSLRSFVFSYEAKLANSGKIRTFINEAVRSWTNYQRNGYFHKHNLFQAENKIDEVREQTIFLYYLILGGLRYSPAQLTELGADPGREDGLSLHFIDLYYSKFESWFDNMVNFDLTSEVPGLWMMLTQDDDSWTITAYPMKYFDINDFESGQTFNTQAIDLNHLRSLPVFRWDNNNAGRDDYKTATLQFWQLFDEYKKSEDNKLNRVNAILLSCGSTTQLVYYRSK